MIRSAACIAVALISAWSNAIACETLDQGCWEAKRAGAAGLVDRNRTCEAMLLEVDATAQHALRHLYARDQVFSPSGRGVDYDNPTGGVGYIDHGDVVHIEREITMIVNVAVRDARYVRYDGADLDSCARIADEAREKITDIRDALP